MPPKVPPARVVRAVEAVRAGVQGVDRRLVPGPIALLELVMGSMVTQAVYVAARLGIADAVVDGPLTVAEIARRVDADPDATGRLLRLLGGYSVFAERPGGRYGQTSMSAALRADAPMSMRGMALLMGGSVHWEDWGHLEDAVRTGEPVVPKLRGMGVYDYLDANPEFAEVFNAGMGNLSNLETDAVAAAYDFTRFGTIVDVFGGRGALLAALLRRAPKARGILVDERAPDLAATGLFREAGVEDRCEIDTTGLFEVPPSGGDAYVLKHILHEWPEPKALEILRNIRGVIGPDGRLLIMEFVVPEGGGRHPAKLVDLWLMLLIGGRERTSVEYAGLLAAAGFTLTRVVGTASTVSIIEARPSGNGAP
ncbi:methyltransferase [Actinomadura meridiana]|uniref:Methyltransferase n=1 Tax=Actinomadura meridiana TaxID=559626 RepID=A0ABP8BSG1_9ACTN